jgi:HPt (histidine-containing phosphotransfer) domain-containing protein
MGPLVNKSAVLEGRCSAAALDDAVLDLAMLASHADFLGRDKVEHLLRLFLAELEPQIVAIVDHLRCARWVEAGRCAHYLKSSASSLGALRLAKLLGAIRAAGQITETPAAEINGLIEQLCAAHDCTKAAVEDWLGSGSI